MKVNFVLMFAPLALCGQSLRLQSEPPAPGHGPAATVQLDSPPGKEPLALQWDLDFAGAALQLDIKDVQAGDAAKVAGKSIVCSLVARKNRDQFGYRCILAGGKNAIMNGEVAILPYSPLENRKTSRSQLRLRNGLAVNGNLKKEPLKDTAVALVN